MDRIAYIIVNNPYPIIIGWVATILGLIIAIITPILQKKRKIIKYISNTTAVINMKQFVLPNLSVKYEGKNIGQLSVTQFQIWNGGNISIDSHDMFPGHELLVKEKDGSDVDFLFSEISFQSSDTIKCGCVCRDDGVGISFQTFEKGDTSVINIFHTGKTGTKLVIVGKMREGIVLKKEARIRFSLGAIKKNKAPVLMFLICIPTLIFYIVTKDLQQVIIAMIFLLFFFLFAIMESDWWPNH